MSDNLILVVDDEPGIVDIARTNLEGLGYRVVSAGNGLEALELIRQENPDLVILDILMPEMDGWQVLEQVEADPEIARDSPSSCSPPG